MAASAQGLRYSRGGGGIASIGNRVVCVRVGCAQRRSIGGGGGGCGGARGSVAGKKSTCAERGGVRPGRCFMWGN